VTVEENKALVRRFYDEVWARGNLDDDLGLLEQLGAPVHAGADG